MHPGECGSDLISKLWFSLYRIATSALAVKLLSVNAIKPHQFNVNTGSDNGLVSPGNKPLPELMLTTGRHWSKMHERILWKEDSWRFSAYAVLVMVNLNSISRFIISIIPAVVEYFFSYLKSSTRDQSGYGLSQWGTVLHCGCFIWKVLSLRVTRML